MMIPTIHTLGMEPGLTTWILWGLECHLGLAGKTEDSTVIFFQYDQEC